MPARDKPYRKVFHLIWGHLSSAERSFQACAVIERCSGAMLRENVMKKIFRDESALVRISNSDGVFHTNENIITVLLCGVMCWCRTWHQVQ